MQLLFGGHHPHCGKPRNYNMKRSNLYFITVSIFCLLFALFSCKSGGGDSGSVNKYRVSGTIFAAENSAIDSDVNDNFADYQSNDRFDEAQELLNPVILGGYVNTPRTGWVGENGDVGRSYYTGDVNDYYSITLTENQSITLSIADNHVDLDLWLYDDNEPPNLVDESRDPKAITESVSATSSGQYFIRVEAWSGASNYVLVVGQPVASATVLDHRMQEDFMPGNVIVAFNDIGPAIHNDLKQPSRSAYKAMTHKSTILDHIQVYKFTPDTADQVFRSMGIPSMESNRALYQTIDPDQQLKLDTLRIIDALNKDPRVRYAEPNYRRYPLLFEPNDPEYSEQWHYPLINLPEAWDVTQGQDVIVAVIDTGILKNHPDIDEQLSADGGYDFISRTNTSNDGDGIDSDPEDPGDDEEGDSSFHGTHVSGTVAAETDNLMGVAGVAFQAKIMPLRALGVGGGYTDDILECMKYAAGLPNVSGVTPAQPAHIINMSIGGGGRQQSTQEVIDIITKDPYNVIIVAAAGNESTDTLSYPASYNGVISVSAVRPDKELASYSNFGSKIDVAAPGGDFPPVGECVLSTDGDDSDGGSIRNGYNSKCGTSMASPHMAGVVALMKALQPDMTPTDLDALLANGILTEDLESDGASVRNDFFGYGLIDAFKAVTAVEDHLPTLLLVDKASLDFGNEVTGTDQIIITLTKSNDNELIDVQSPIVSASWLTVEPDPSVYSQGLGEYTVNVDRSQVATDGPYYASITFISTQNSVEVSVVMYKGDITVVGDSGLHYVLLLDGDTFDTVEADKVFVDRLNGTYSYSFPSVAEGRYVVFAGTDSDNDFLVGDPGEARGAYVSPSQSIYLNVSRDLSGIDFDTAFEFSISVDQLPTKNYSHTVYRRFK